MKSYYREVAEKFEKTELKLYEVLVADCALCYEHIADLNNKDFDIICNYIYEWIMNSEATADEIASIINGILEDKVFKISDFYNDTTQLRDWINNSF